jgi:hypothetical protein
MEVGVRCAEGQLSMSVAADVVSKDQPEADCFQARHVGEFVGGVGTVRSMSITGFANSPLTAVEPTWLIATV